MCRSVLLNARVRVHALREAGTEDGMRESESACWAETRKWRQRQKAETVGGEWRWRRAQRSATL